MEKTARKTEKRLVIKETIASQSNFEKPPLFKIHEIRVSFFIINHKKHDCQIEMMRFIELRLSETDTSFRAEGGRPVFFSKKNFCFSPIKRGAAVSK